MSNIDVDAHKSLAKATFNQTWDLLDKEDRTIDDEDQMLELAHASAHHWRRAGNALNAARAQWMLSRVHSVVGLPHRALHHANNCQRITKENEFGSFDAVFAYEALARAEAVAGDESSARASLAAATELLDGIDSAEDRAQCQADIDDIMAMLNA